LTALAIDGGNAFADRRSAQSAADNAALAGALAKVTGQNINNAALTITRDNNRADGTVTIQNPPGPGCNGTTPNIVIVNDPWGLHHDELSYYVQVVIRSSVNTFFGPVIGINQVHSCVQAIAHGKPELTFPPFAGNAIVGLDPNGNSFDSGQSNSAWWKISGGGIFANHNAHSKNSDSVTFPDGKCVTSVGTTSGFACTPVGQNRADLFINYPSAVMTLIASQWPTPLCNGTAFLGPDGMIHPEAGKDGSVVDRFEGVFAPGLFCFPDANGNGGVVSYDPSVNGLGGVTFYISDPDFTRKFAGSGSYLNASAPTSGIYKGLLIFGPITPTPCTQNLEIRGNGTTPFVGTVFLPSACLDYRGNGTAGVNSQFIGYDITSNGTADVVVAYNPNDGGQITQPAFVGLTK
jgi:Putative Flp pilus-assembly TadE/G-like